MLTIHRAQDRGKSTFSWLDSQHTFSFGQYMDPRNMGFSDLRVINEDRVIPGAGFGTHAHRDMEIISYVVEGELAHRDSMGTGSVIRPGDVQRMTAGTGVTHSEMNASKTDPVHFLQIWILPNAKGLAPGYEQKHFAPETRQNQWRLVGAPDGQDGAVTIHQDVNLYAATVEKGAQLDYALAGDRKAWLQVVKGSLSLEGETLHVGDGAAIADMDTFSAVADDKAEVLLFDLAA